MASGFGIEAFAQEFAQDTDHVIARLRQLTQQPVTTAQDAVSRATSIGHQAHALQGVLGTVGATTLADRMGQLKAVAQAAATTATSSGSADASGAAERLRATVATHLEELSESLQNLLAGHPEAAEAVLQPLADAVAAMPGAEEHPLVSRSPDEAETSAPPTVDPELLAAFAEETAELAEPIRQARTDLVATPSDPAGYDRIARLAHRLKGAAALVELEAVRAPAEALEQAARRVAESADPADEQRAASIDRDLGELYEACVRCSDGVGETGSETTPFAEAGSSRPARTAARDEAAGGPLAESATDGVSTELPEADAELAAIFAEELDLFREEALQRVVAVGRAVDDPAGYDTLARAFHRIKGAAATVGLEALAEQALAGEQHCTAVAEGHTAADAEAARQARTAMVNLLAHADRPQPVDGPTAEASAEAGTAPPGDADASPAVEVEPELLEAFLHDARDIAQRLEEDALALEATRDDTLPSDRLERIARDLHTVKGAASSVGLSELAGLLHAAEDVLSRARSEQALPVPLAEVVLLVHDRVASQGEEWPQVGVAEAERRSALTAQRLRAWLDPKDAASADPATEGGAALAPEPAEEPSAHQSVDATPYVRVQAAWLDQMLELLGELATGHAAVSAQLQAMAEQRQLIARCDQRLRDELRRFQERFEFADRRFSPAAPRADDGAAEDELDQLVRRRFGHLEFDEYTEMNRFSRRLLEHFDDTNEATGRALDLVQRIGEPLQRARGVARSMQQELLEARMLPVGDLFRRLRRPIRDAATQEGKQVQTTLVGERVAVDKALLGRLYEPLVHLVRNAVSHGIEPPEQRLAGGKPAAGQITMAAGYEGGEVRLTLRDDGSGIDPEAVAARARELGWLPAEAATPTDPGQLVRWLFDPGFSTRREVGQVAGRGIGMDVAKRSIEALRGRLELHSEPGAGTRLEIRLPRTLSVLEVLIVQSGGQHYALPVDDVVLCEAESHAEGNGSDDAWPRRSLAALLGREAWVPPHRRPTLVRVQLGEARVALRVEGVLQQREVLVKSLGPLLQDHPWYLGATLTTEGEPLLILDLSALLTHARSGTPQPAAHQDREVRQDREPSTVPAMAQDAGPTSPTPAGAGARKTHVLVVDDSLSVRRVAERYLTLEGCRVTLATDGLEALERLRAAVASGDPPALVFTDLEMPRIHGYGLIQQMKREPELCDIPVVVVTSRGGDKHRAMALELGATDYVTKPFTRQALGQQVARLTSPEAGQRTNAPATTPTATPQAHP